MSFAVGVGLLFTCCSKDVDEERENNDSLTEVSESKYIDPFDSSLPVVRYEDLTFEERKVFDEFRNRRKPDDVPGLRKIAEYYYPYYSGEVMDPGTMMFYNGKFVELK